MSDVINFPDRKRAPCLSLDKARFEGSFATEPRRDRHRVAVMARLTQMLVSWKDESVIGAGRDWCLEQLLAAVISLCDSKARTDFAVGQLDAALKSLRRPGP